MTKNTPSADIQIHLLSVDALAEDPRNARMHSAEQIQQIAASIKEFGFTNPLLISKDNTVIAGHGRLAAAKLLKLKEVPTIYLGHLTPEQQRAYIIADNKLALNASWDDTVLAKELKALASLNFSLETLGFSAKELRNLLLDESHAEPTCAPELGTSFSYQIVLQCDDEEQQAALLERFTSEGLTCRPLIL